MSINMDRLSSRLFIVCILTFAWGKAWADTPEYHLTLENHLFFPAELEIPVNKKVKLIIHNKDNVAEEFDSFDLNREKVIFAGKKSTVYIGPLKEGEYHFFGEYNPHTATGRIIVKGKANVN